MNRIFTITISDADNVATLKQKIKEAKHPADTLNLWNVSMVVDTNFNLNLNKADFPQKESLSPVIELSEVFPNLPIEDRLHIMTANRNTFDLKKRRRTNGDWESSSQVWQYLEGKEWKEFHQDWWGERGQIKLEDAASTKVLHIKQPTVVQFFGLLWCTDGKLYVRDEVNQTYLDLERAYDMQQQRGEALSGVLLTGQPGLGKSTDIMHIVTKRMSLRQNTLFTSANSAVFWISKDGVQLCSERANTITYSHLLLLDRGSSPWSVIDAGPQDVLSSPSQSLFKHPFFAIYTAPPNITRYKYWLKEQQTTVYIMQPWDWEEKELLECMKLFSNTTLAKIDDHNISGIRYHCEPLPCDIWSYVRGEPFFKANVQWAAAALTVEAILTILLCVERLSSESNLASHELLIVRRLFRNSTETLSDAYEVDFISPFVENLLRKRFPTFVLDDAKRLFWASSLVPETSVFGGWIFEARAMKYTAGQIAIDNDDAFGPFRRMKVDVDDSKFTDETLITGMPPFRVEKDANQGGIVKLFQGSSLIACDNLFDFTSCSQPMRFMDDRRLDLFHRREFFHYSDISSVAIRPDCYYVSSTDNPLVDAFFFDNLHEEHFYLQMLIAKRNGGFESGLRLVQTLKQRVELGNFAQGRAIKVRYLLVAPARTHAVSWTMPEEWGDSKYLDIKGT